MALISQAINWFVATRFWKWMTKRIISRLSVRIFGNPLFPMDKWYEIEQIVKDNHGKLLVFVSHGTKLSSWMVRFVASAQWTHAGVILMKNGRVEIVHMESVGLLQQVLLTLLREVDDFAVVEIPLTEEELLEAWGILRAYIQAKPGYDFQFLLNNNALYCSELIFNMVKKSGRFAAHREQGRLVFEPEDVYRMGKVLFEHRS